jgi:Ca2+-transporting ATPase
MTVEEVYVDGQILRPGDPGIKKMNRLLQALALSNDAEKDCEGNLIGDPTETALYVAAEEQGVWKENLQTSMPRVAEVPFDSERKRMTTIHRSDDGHFISFTKGALDTILERADRVLSAEGVIPLDKAQIMKVNDNMAGKGLRVLCVAMKSWEAMPATITSDSVETDLTIIGLVGLMAPPRQERKTRICVQDTVSACYDYGDHRHDGPSHCKKDRNFREGRKRYYSHGFGDRKEPMRPYKKRARHVGFMRAWRGTELRS